MNHTQLTASALIGSADPGLLDEAARYAAVRRASVPCASVPEPTPAPDPSPDQAGPRYSGLVNLVLGLQATERDPVLLEALDLLADAGRKVPTRLLVRLLEFTRGNSAVAEKLAGVLDERGRWLAAQNPAWAKVLVGVDPRPVDWDEGSHAQRVAWLRHVRRADPAAGRQLVEQVRREKASERADFVSALEEGLSKSDEDLLESLLSDRSKLVAAQAARLLSHIDGSAYLGRLEDAAGGVFVRRRKLYRSSIEATAPPLEAAERDFWDEASSFPLPGRVGPERRIQKLVSLVRPSRWPEICGVKAKALLGEVLLDGEVIDLTDALSAAALHFGDTDLAGEIARNRPDPKVLRLLPEAEQVAVITAALSDDRQDDGGRLLLAVRRRYLPDAIVAALLKRGRRELASGNDKAAFCWVFPKIAQRADPSRATELINELNILAAGLDVQHNRIAEAARHLSLRQSIYQAVHDKENQ